MLSKFKEFLGGEKIRRESILLLFTLISVVILCSAVSAADPVDSANIYVSPTGNDTDGDGSSSNPYQTIEIGLITVNNTGTIHLASGTYSSNTTGHKDYDLVISKNITIQGAGIDQTIIDAGGKARIFEILGDLKVSIKDLTFINGNATASAPQYGGAIYNYGTLTLVNCKFENNTGREAGAIDNGNILDITSCDFVGNTATNAGGAIRTDANMIIRNSNFRNNQATDGGAIYSNPDNEITIIGCNFENNIAGAAGAINNWACNFTITDSTFKNNNANEGGAIKNIGFSSSCSMTITGCTFLGNTADDGGAISNSENLTVTDSIFENNQVFDGWGGAIFNSWGTSTIIRSIFTNNTAYRGGAIYNGDTASNVTGCNFNSNTAINNGGAIYGHNADSGSPLTVKYSRFVGNNVGTTAQDIYMRHQSLDARYNWWGSNNGPASRVTGDEFSVITYTPWLVLNINADPSTINAGKTSKITANVYMDSAGGDHSADAAQFFSGSEVKFTTNLGNVGSKEVTVPWALGLADATLRGDEGPGIATVGAVDGETVSRTVTILGDSAVNTIPTVSAASSLSTTRTVGMQETGLPIAGLILAILMLFGGLVSYKR